MASITKFAAASSLLFSSLVKGQAMAPPMLGSIGNMTVAGNGSAASDDGKYTIMSEGIRAQFVPYGVSCFQKPQTRLKTFPH